MIFIISILSLCTFLLVVLSFIGVVGFTANDVIQFGMDQLHDSRGKTGPSSYTGMVCLGLLSQHFLWPAGMEFSV